MFSKDPFIFVNGKGRIMASNTMHVYLRKLSRDAFGPDFNKILTLHVFRNSYISLLVELGVPMKVIIERVGHANEKMTMSLQTYMTEKMQPAEREKLMNFSF